MYNINPKYWNEFKLCMQEIKAYFKINILLKCNIILIINLPQFMTI